MGYTREVERSLRGPAFVPALPRVGRDIKCPLWPFSATSSRRLWALTEGRQSVQTISYLNGLNEDWFGQMNIPTSPAGSLSRTASSTSERFKM